MSKSYASFRAFVQRNRWWILWFAALFLARSLVIDWYYVPSGSMYPSIQERHYIAINRLAYSLHIPFTNVQIARWSSPHRGDPIVLFDPHDGTRLVKRVIGVAGDTIALEDGQVVRNGEKASYTPGAGNWPAEPGLIQSSWVEQWQDGSWEPVMRTESHVAWDMHRNVASMRVPTGMLMVMGDNRDNSEDSRVIGFIPIDNVAGRIWLHTLDKPASER